MTMLTMLRYICLESESGSCFYFLYFARFSRDLDLVAKRQEWSRIKDVWPWLTGRWSLLC